MSPVFIVTIIQQSLLEILMTTGPVLVVSLLVGLVIAIFQAVTSIQEQTLTFVPKIIAIFLVIGFSGPWVINRLIDYFVRIMEFIPQV